MKRLEETARFQARGEDGSVHIVIERTAIVTFKPLSGPAQHAKGTKDYVTALGEDLNQIDDDTYQFVFTNQIIKRI